MVKCVTCGGELGLRERYERSLDLLEAGLVVYRMNNLLEGDPNDPTKMKAVMEASVQLYDILGQYWNDIPGDTLKEKLAAVESRRMNSDKKEESQIITGEK